MNARSLGLTQDTITLFLCGDVMTGRGIDQILSHPNTPELHESYVRDAREYVTLAEQTNGPIARPVEPFYIWGDALAELDRVAPDARIINLETSITCSDAHWPGKGIHYRMHPANIACLTTAHIDVCTLANNHVLDYGYAGLADTLDALHAAGIRTAGAGRNQAEAELPASVEFAPNRRVIVLSLGSHTSGVPFEWAAAPDRAGVDALDELSESAVDRVLQRVARVKRPGDIVIASIHWGTNWGYDVPTTHVHFAHRLLDGGVTLVHGHSSHHPRALEVYNQKLVLYGCGDFLTDYEGIGGYEEFRGDLALMYFPMIDVQSGQLIQLRMVPMCVRRMQATRASSSDAEWLGDTLSRASSPFGERIDPAPGAVHSEPALRLASGY
jgi:poly-gamma-glutamate capsule biosynthesis protein CapA/YwtB (metallophosphatase superfamily)